MKTAEEILANTLGTSSDLLDPAAHCRVSSTLQAMKEYATEAIKADRERVKQEIRYPLGFVDGKIANEERIVNRPIELP